MFSAKVAQKHSATVRPYQKMAFIADKRFQMFKNINRRIFTLIVDDYYIIYKLLKSTVIFWGVTAKYYIRW